MAQRKSQRVDRTKTIESYDQQAHGRISYPIKGDSRVFDNVGKKHFWSNVIRRKDFEPPRDAEENLTPMQPLNYKLNENLKYNLSRNLQTDQQLKRQTPMRKLRKEHQLNLTINPEDIGLKKRQNYDKQQTTKPEKINELQAHRRVRTELENYAEKQQAYLKTEKYIQQADRHYFNLMEKPNKNQIKLPPIEHNFFDSPKAQLTSEYHSNYLHPNNILKRQPQNLKSIRHLMRKINPTFASSLKNPLTDINLQIKLLNEAE